jgi:hypothetical protein
LPSAAHSAVGGGLGIAADEDQTARPQCQVPQNQALRIRFDAQGIHPQGIRTGIPDFQELALGVRDSGRIRHGLGKDGPAGTIRRRDQEGG